MNENNTEKGAINSEIKKAPIFYEDSEEVGGIRVEYGVTISEAITAGITRADTTKEPVKFLFNETEVNIPQKSKFEDISKKWSDVVRKKTGKI